MRVHSARLARGNGSGSESASAWATFWLSGSAKYSVRPLPTMSKAVRRPASNRPSKSRPASWFRNPSAAGLDTRHGRAPPAVPGGPPTGRGEPSPPSIDRLHSTTPDPHPNRPVRMPHPNRDATAAAVTSPKCKAAPSRALNCRPAGLVRCPAPPPHIQRGPPHRGAKRRA